MAFAWVSVSWNSGRNFYLYLYAYMSVYVYVIWVHFYSFAHKHELDWIFIYESNGLIWMNCVPTHTRARANKQKKKLRVLSNRTMHSRKKLKRKLNFMEQPSGNMMYLNWISLSFNHKVLRIYCTTLHYTMNINHTHHLHSMRPLPCTLWFTRNYS